MPELPPPLALLDMFDSPVTWRVLAVGVLTNVACALVGCYLVLRRMSLMGDALSHAVLPGLVLAFLFSGSLNIGPLFLGAVAVGLLTTFLTQSLHQFGRVPTDASMGVVFTSLFAFGVVLIKRYLEGIHFDAACVYQGSMLKVALETAEFGPWNIPRGVMTIGPVVLMNIVFIALFWKELKLSSFDPALATSMGFSATLMHYALMSLVAVTTVASFEAVGAILVVAMLIVPPATAHLLCDRLSRMVVVSCILGALAAVLGYGLARHWNVAPAAMMAVAAGGFYALAVLFSPKYGVLSTLAWNLSTSLRVVREDLLAMLYRLEELASPGRLSAGDARQAVGGGLLARWALGTLVRTRQIAYGPTGMQLTDSGREAAKNLVRSHRLWESYLVQHLGLPLDHVHEPAHRVEHFIGEGLRQDLEQALDETGQDPHGREIPS